MSKRLTFLSAVAFSVASALPLVAEETPTSATVVATVNGAEITLGHVAQIYTDLPQQYKQVPADQLFNGLLDQLIQQTVLQQTLTGEISKKVRLGLENQRRTLLASAALDQIGDAAVTPEALQAEYDKSYANAEPTTEYSAAHILVADRDAAQKLTEDARGGADFAALAKEHSTGPSGPNGGDLGWFGTGAMVPPFEAAVVALEPGQISDPVATQFGWHVIKLNEIREVSAPPLEEVTGELEEIIRNAALNEAMAGLLSGAKIDLSVAKAIDPTLMKQSAILED